MSDPRFAKFVVFVNSALPLVLLCWDEYTGHAGADPQTHALLTAGMLALIFLSLSLAVTPVRKITGWNWLSHFRRMLGLFAFFYAALHFGIYFVYRQSGSVTGVLRDTVQHPYILFGMGALGMMIPLAWTSTNAAIKRMGAKRWKDLHRLAYYAAILGVLHYWLLVKADISKPMAFAIALGVLLGYRILEAQFPFLHRTPTARRVGLAAKTQSDTSVVS